MVDKAMPTCHSGDMQSTYQSHRAEHPFAEFLAQLTLDSSWVDQEASSEVAGWFGRVGRRIVHQTPQGFLNYDKFDTDADAIEVMDVLERSVTNFE
jgi:hypothetical protein